MRHYPSKLSSRMASRIFFSRGAKVFLTASGETVVRLSRSPTGYWTGGGIVGRARVKGMFARIANEVVVWFQQQGLLVTTRHMT